MDNEILVVIVEPNKEPRLMQVKNTLKAAQEIVGGYIEVVGLNDRIDLICNDEGLYTMPYNRKVGNYSIHGTFFLTTHDDDGEFTSLSEFDIAASLRFFRLGNIHSI